MNDRLSDDPSDFGTENAHTDEQAALYHTEWDGKDCVGGTVVRAVAALSDTEPTALDSLYDAVDPDALDTIVTSLDGADGGHVTFSYAGYDVVIRSNGQLTLCPQGN